MTRLDKIRKRLKSVEDIDIANRRIGIILRQQYVDDIKYLLDELEVANAKIAEFEKGKAERTVVFPCGLKDWLYYIQDDEIRKAKVEELAFNSVRSAHPSDTTIHAWNFVKKEELTYEPNRYAWTESSEGFVPVFLTREAAEQALAEKGGSI